MKPTTDCALCIDPYLQRHRAVSLLQHGCFDIIIFVDGVKLV